ncbi:hypothetical protein QAD02_017332 [Eretmocerus hayati]|uniref:Uncharacterized protein n=1 Tax=Eretmocerus hayati TaxID=131215 RepID=A0ACC2PID7_9HYME|nr:hypothetical protein QAD02_017332 [Eretmocerus hayati]
MILGRCSLQAIKLASDISKNYVNSRGRGISLIECNTNSKKASPVHQIFSKKMASTSSASGDEHLQCKNKLALEKSPYLLQHATNPVDWYPWGEEALEKARREDKLIFLSVGYSTCHWCHVMEKESFENPDVAKVMNEYFVNIKVDREERPDIDRVYMTFIQSISGHGGWPMSVFLTPDLTPVTGGTYFPPTDRYGQPGFRKILESIGSKWKDNKQEFLDSGANILKILKKSVATKSRAKNEIPSADCADTCVKQLINGYESKFGGFSSAPKFPQPVNFNLLFLMYSRNPTSDVGKQSLKMCMHTLSKMANGGIHDHVGQGFSRYSVDGKWHVPHFEKMLYDQAQLMRSFAEAYLASKDEFFADITNDIATYVVRDLRHPEGAFYSAEDADSLPSYDDIEKREGAFYVWTHDEIEFLLDRVIQETEGIRASDLFCFHFSVKPEGNVQRQQDPHGELSGKNVLIIFGSAAETAAHFNISEDLVKSSIQESLKILFEERNKRPRPHLDDKIVTAWNGLMISGLSQAAGALDNSLYTEYAEAAARFIEKYLYDHENQILLRSCYRGEANQIVQGSAPIRGFQVDYAFVIRGLLDLYEVSLDSHWLEFAEKLQNIQDRLFWDDESSGYYSTTKEDVSVILRIKDDQDGAEPSGNSVACGNLVRLASYLNRPEFSEKAVQLLNFMEKTLINLPVACPELVTALVTLTDSITQVYIVGNKGSEDTKKLLKVVRSTLLPGRVIMLADGNDPDNILYRSNNVIGKMKQHNGRATAYVCHHRVCSLPVTDPEQLMELLIKK